MITYALIGILIILFIGFMLNRNNSSKTETSIEKDQKTKPKDNPYMDMRNMALAMTSDQLGIEASVNNDKVYGVIADLDMNGAIVTITAFVTGDTSLYLSTGGGFIGAGQHEDVQEVVKKFLHKADGYAIKGEKYDITELPKPKTAIFYFLSDKGNTKIVETLSNLESGKSEYSELFYELNQVMTAIRLKSGE